MGLSNELICLHWSHLSLSILVYVIQFVRYLTKLKIWFWVGLFFYFFFGGGGKYYHQPNQTESNQRSEMKNVLVTGGWWGVRCCSLNRDGPGTILCRLHAWRSGTNRLVNSHLPIHQPFELVLTGYCVIRVLSFILRLLVTLSMC